MTKKKFKSKRKISAENSAHAREVDKAWHKLQEGRQKLIENERLRHRGE